MASLPPNPISGLLGGSNTPVSPPKPSSAPPGLQTVDSSPMGSLPLTLAPKGELALPPNPITQSLLTGPKPVSPLMVGRPGHQHPVGAMDQFQHQAEAAAAPAVADYNRRSGGTQGIVPGMKPEDLAQIRESASRNPGVAAAMGSITNPEAWVAGAVHGAKDVAGGVGKAVHGNLGGGSEQAGLGALGVAGILPLGKVGKIGELAGEALLRRTPEEAAQHVFDAASSAKAEGFGPVEGGGKSNPPLVKKGEATPATGGELGVQVREAMQGSGKARTEQAGFYHDERAARAAAASDALARGDYEGALHELKGALPKVDFQGFKQFDEQTVRAMESHVMDHPVLRTYEKINTIQSLRAALQGKVPTQGEQKLLERAFGKEISGQISDSAGEIRKWPKMLVNLANVPRSLMASMDLSAPFRQGLVAGVSHPVIFAKNFAPMLKAARSESYFQNMIQDEIHARPTYPLMEKAKIAFTDIGKDAAHGAGATSQREEQFMSNYAEQIPGLGRVVRGSDRAYVGFLNKIRADVFDHLVQEASMQGHDVADEKFLQSVGKFVNSATGRGSIGPLTNHTATMNALFFSPRLLASRINFLNPVYYMKLDPFARKEALKALLSLAGTATTILEIARMGGAKVNTNPTNADFGKIRVGNTRVDILGGFQQPIRLAAQLITNKVTSSTTGKVIPLGSGFAKTSRYDVIMKFLQGKLSPIPSLVVDATKGQDFTGKKLKWNDLSTYERVAASRMVPFLAQDIYDLETTSGPGAAAGLAPLDLFGVGVQAYKAKTPKASGGSSSPGYGDTGGSYGDSGSGGYGDTGSSYGG